MTRYPSGNRDQKMVHCGHKGMGHRNDQHNDQVDSALILKEAQNVAKF